MLGIAQTGTGKTAAFVLPMLCRLEQGRARARVPRTLILEPTRELAAQVEEAFIKYGSQHKLNVALLIGGVSFGDQEQKIMRGADVLIATPGRLLDFFERGKLLLGGIEILVIDEADRMLDMGFIPDIEKICKLVPFTRQTLFFSATMPPEITRLTEQFLHNPARVEVARAATTASTIAQALVASHGGGDKRETLRRLLREAVGLKNAIVFCNRKRDVAIVHKSLEKHGFPVGCLHGDMDQSARMASLDAFKNGAVDILVCSDVAARGLDIPDVSHVFNFDVPTHSEDYVHRIGRTGRAGRSGAAFTIVTSDDGKYIAQIEDLIKQQIEWRGPKLDELSAPEYTERDRERSARHGDRSGSRRGGRAPSSRGPRPERQERSANSDRQERSGSSERQERSGSERQERSGSERHERSGSERHERSASPERHERSERAERPARSRPVEAEARAPRKEPREAGEARDYSRDTPRPRRGQSVDNDPPVIGLGDHVPSFLLRPVRVKGAKPAE